MGGAGYRQLARLDHRRNVRFDSLHAILARNLLSRAGGSFELWLGRGLPVNPYLRGLLIDILRHEMRPKEIRMYPDEVIIAQDPLEFLEWTMLRSWVQSWLQYCRWYYITALDPGIRIDDFFSAPIYCSHWKANRKS